MGTHPRRLHRAGGARHGRKRPGYIRCSSATHSPPANRRPQRRSAGANARGRLRDQVLGSRFRSLPAPASPRRCGLGVKASESKTAAPDTALQGSARRPYPRLRTVGQTGSKRTALGGTSGRSPGFPGNINHGLDTGMRARAEIPPISGKSHHQALRRGPVCSQDLSTTHSMGEHSCRQRTRLPATGQELTWLTTVISKSSSAYSLPRRTSVGARKPRSVNRNDHIPRRSRNDCRPPR